MRAIQQAPTGAVVAPAELKKIVSFLSPYDDFQPVQVEANFPEYHYVSTVKRCFNFGVEFERIPTNLQTDPPTPPNIVNAVFHFDIEIEGSIIRYDRNGKRAQLIRVLENAFATRSNLRCQKKFWNLFLRQDSSSNDAGYANDNNLYDAWVAKHAGAVRGVRTFYDTVKIGRSDGTGPMLYLPPNSRLFGTAPIYINDLRLFLKKLNDVDVYAQGILKKPMLAPSTTLQGPILADGTAVTGRDAPSLYVQKWWRLRLFRTCFFSQFAVDVFSHPMPGGTSRDYPFIVPGLPFKFEDLYAKDKFTWDELMSL